MARARFFAGVMTTSATAPGVAERLDELVRRVRAAKQATFLQRYRNSDPEAE